LDWFIGYWCLTPLSTMARYQLYKEQRAGSIPSHAVLLSQNDKVCQRLATGSIPIKLTATI
jgi:hypothetical protein